MSVDSTNASHDAALQKYLSLPANDDRVQAEYVWIGGSGEDVRCKSRTLPRYPKSLEEIPDWNFDGSSTGQAEGWSSEVWLRPVKFVRDPFRPHQKNILVLCECLNASTFEPFDVETNRRWRAKAIFSTETAKAEECWFGLEQEYTMFDARSKCMQPLGWPDSVGSFPEAQGKYYCSVGADRAFGRQIAEAHYRCCLFAGLDISGINAEVMPGQWEFQIGPTLGIDAGDQLWLARFMLHRVAEDFGVLVSLAPKPVKKGDWNGTGCHCNFSTKTMRAEGGYAQILEAIDNLSKRHTEHMAVYGENNHERMTGACETAKYDEFSFGVAHRGRSVRIPRAAQLEGKGYFEDRRPAANCDPYDVTSIIVETSLKITIEEPKRATVTVMSDADVATA